MLNSLSGVYPAGNKRSEGREPKARRSCPEARNLVNLLKDKNYYECMMDEKFKKTIKIIHKRLEYNKIKWALVGSTNMQLQGMNVSPHDLDVVVQLKDLEKTREIFSDYDASAVKELKPLTDEPAWEVRMEIDGVEVQIFAQMDTGAYVSKLLANKLVKMILENVEIPCFTLEVEAQTYAETNREHKAHLIQEFLKRA